MGTAAQCFFFWGNFCIPFLSLWAYYIYRHQAYFGKYKVNMCRLCIGVHLSHACFLLLFSAVTEAGKVGDDLAKKFFKEEYILNYKIGE